MAPRAATTPVEQVLAWQRTAGNRAVTSLFEGGRERAAATVQRRIASDMALTGESRPATGAAFGVTTSLHGVAGKPLLDMATESAGRRIHVHLEPQRPLRLTEVSGWNVKAGDAHLYIDNTRARLDTEDLNLFDTYAPGWDDHTRYAGGRAIQWGQVPRTLREQARGAVLGQHQSQQDERKNKARQKAIDKLNANPAPWLREQAGADTPRTQSFTIPHDYLARGKRGQGAWQQALTEKIRTALAGLPAGASVKQVHAPQGKARSDPLLKIEFESFDAYRRARARVAELVAGLHGDAGPAAGADEWAAWVSGLDDELDAHLDQIAAGRLDLLLGIY